MLAKLTKLVMEATAVELEVPLNREAKIVAKRQRRVEDMVISQSAKGPTTGEISAHMAEVYGAEMSNQMISTIAERMMGRTLTQN